MHFVLLVVKDSDEMVKSDKMKLAFFFHTNNLTPYSVLPLFKETRKFHRSLVSAIWDYRDG